MAVPEKSREDGREKGFEMSKKLLALLMGCAVALCIGLVGCGGNNGGAAQNNPEGVWDIQNVDELLEASMGASGTTLPDAAKKKAAEIMPDICFLNINGDKTFQLVAMGQAIDGTWELKGSDLTMTAQGSPITGKLDGSTLTIENNGTKMVFTKTGDKPRAVPTEEEMTNKLMELAMSAMS